jgi:hypothetical protein
MKPWGRAPAFQPGSGQWLGDTCNGKEWWWIN